MMNEKKPPTELDTFLPSDGTVKDGVLPSKFKVQPKTMRDTENGTADGKGFDPFLNRKVENATTDWDTLTHLLKASLGTGILFMPLAFRYSGLLVGVIATILVAFVCTHCAYILVKCAHSLYYKTQVSEMSFATVAEVAFATGPKWARKFAKPFKYSIKIGLFVTYFLTCSAYAVIIAQNINAVLKEYDMELNIRIMISALLLPLILMSWVPDLKYLAPVSMIANLFMGAGLGITFYYLVTNIDPNNFKNLTAPLFDFPKFFSLTIFAMEAIGVIMPLENSMKTPQHFIGFCGVLNKGMSGVTLIYIILGFFGYLAHGNNITDIITLNLPPHNIYAQAVQISIALAVYCTFGLQFYVCLDIAWDGIKDRFTKMPHLANYILRTSLVIGIVAIAVAVPYIGPFLSLIGAFCFSIIGLLIPVFIETITYWETGFGYYNWVAMKNIAIIVIGISALVSGSYSSIEDIIKALQVSN